MGAAAKTAYNEKDVEKLRKNVKDTNWLLDKLEKLGVEFPLVKKAINRIGIAINTGTDIGEAAHETSQELEKANDLALKACKGDEFCELDYMRKWQSRNVQWTLDPKNDKSVLSKSIDKTLARNVPVLCKMFDRCAKELEKQEKASKK